MNIAKNCVSRLSSYKNALTKLKNLGFTRVFSDNLADLISVTSSQVRKDFSLFGISGNRKGGYNIEELFNQINHILGKDIVHNIIIVGAGYIGKALMKYKTFEKEGIKIRAVFDSDPAKINRESSIPILPVKELKEFIQAQRIKIGIITVPENSAQLVLDQMIDAGIQGVLNFAPINLKEYPGIIINNVNIELELENVIYYTQTMENNKK
ncbi:MAG: redox-sensing transcriptional repressor Rex [Candidatus Aureabacteria bacterium]|nr:redox-sensing transcriptional repressor Rex [Candidatus Auribacterota bacterium]